MKFNWTLMKTILIRTLVSFCILILLAFLLGPVIQLAITTSTEGFYEGLKNLFKMNRVLFNAFISLFLAVASIVIEKKQQKQ